MPKRHNDLFGHIASFQTLHHAARRAVRGKRGKAGAAAFMARLEPECLRLERELQEGSYRSGRYLEIVVHDPKRRVVHHALCSVIGPLFERGFFSDSYANRVGKGTHRAIARYEHYRDRYRHVLRGDIWRYFPAIDHAILRADLRRRIACQRTLALCDSLIDGSNPQEPVSLYFPGDDLFTPYERARGLPLGNLTSQFFANVYLDGLDHFVTEVLRAPYLRYVDDFALFGRDPAQLAEWRTRIGVWLEGRRLRLHPDKTFVSATAEPAAFLGLVLHRGGLRRLPGANVARFRQRLGALRDGWRTGQVAEAELRQCVGAWVAHARHAHTEGLRHALLGGGWFDPFWADGTPAQAQVQPSR